MLILKILFMNSLPNYGGNLFFLLLSCFILTLEKYANIDKIMMRVTII